MKALAILACLLTAAILVVRAPADIRQAEPTWAQTQLAKRRAEVKALKQQVRDLRRTLAHKPSVQEAIRLAALAYGQSYSKLHRIASCESGLYRYAKNRSSSASGLFQFLYPSTWRSTPFAAESVWSSYASALAAGWMFANGRGGEWVCR